MISFAVGLQPLQVWVRKIYVKYTQENVCFKPGQDCLSFSYWLQHISHTSGEYSSKPLKHSIVKRIFTYYLNGKHGHIFIH